MTYKLAIVGVGKIARDQHIPAIAANPNFELTATASRNAEVGGIPAWRDLASLLDAKPEINCVSLCTPPQVRYSDARLALEAGRHVMLEKPPGATLSEVHDLVRIANERELTLFATWHSRHAAAVAHARNWLRGKKILRLAISWKEDVRQWHPGQEWIWEAGGLGIFDPGINALSVMTEILPQSVHLKKAELFFPSNRQTPIAAQFEFHDPCGAEISAELDWREQGPPAWNIEVETTAGIVQLSDGGAKMKIDGADAAVGPDAEYPGLYARFADLLDSGESDVDLTPMLHVSDAFTLGKRVTVEPFDW